LEQNLDHLCFTEQLFSMNFFDSFLPSFPRIIGIYFQHLIFIHHEARLMGIKLALFFFFSFFFVYISVNILRPVSRS